jgi:hypothetical protein
MMSTVYEAIPGRTYGFIEPTNLDGKPFAPSREWLDFSVSDHCGELFEVSYENPYWALESASGNTLCVMDFDPGDEHCTGGAFRITQTIDATDLLFQYARRVALVAAGRWGLPSSVGEFLASGDLAAASVIVGSEWNIGEKSHHRRRVQDDGEWRAQQAAQLIALGAIVAYTEVGRHLRTGVAGQFGMAIYCADESVRNRDAERQFNDFVADELAKDSSRSAAYNRR